MAPQATGEAMHIPDGYLSPASCALGYAAALPLCYLALRRVERQLEGRTVPTLAVFSAFSFVVMMFNLPLPGGTSGHATGLGIAAVVLGPWAGMLAMVVALAVQALFFGDGGISTLGANCFNMGCLGVGSAYLLYWAVAAGAALDSRRRVLAVALAGYLGINLAALAAAIEFGVQPLWFHDAGGTPLYAPYPLAIAIPAMMIGHLGPAGIAEALLGGALVSWLQKAQPELLRNTAGTCVAAAGADAPAVTGWSSLRKMLALLGALMLLAPLGQLAAGSAWGEWGAADFKDAQKRAQIIAASADQPLPPEAPQGLQQLSGLWQAPLADYALPLLPPALGYSLAALLGVALSLLLWLLLGRTLGRRRRSSAQR